MLDRSGNAVSVFTPTVVRIRGRVLRNETGACVSAEKAPFSDEAVRLLAHINWWGGATVQTKTDARDGLPKLMEVNPRLGTNLWIRTEIGINEPLLCLQIARAKSPRPIVPGVDYPLDRMLLDPFADFMNFFAELAELNAPFLERAKAEVLYRGQAGPDFAGEETWDVAILVQYPSFAAFSELVTDPAWGETAGALRHRTLEDAKPIVTFPPSGS